MVYHKVLLIAGKLIDRSEADKREFVDEHGFVEVPYKELVHPYPCCLTLAGERYIVGRVMHTFYRKKLSPCGNPIHPGEESKGEVEDDPEVTDFDVCGKYFSCNKCLGTCTTGGNTYWFDVSNILDSVVEENPLKICTLCYNIECYKGDTCNICGYQKYCDEADGPVYDIMDWYFYRKEKPKFYLLVDDCLSCT